MTTAAPRDRLFVPLAAAPFDWFEAGDKEWELRRHGRQWTERHVRVGRRVELRRGYAGSRSILGTVADVVVADDPAAFFELVDYRLVLPLAASLREAMTAAVPFIGEGVRLIGFRIERDAA